MSSSVPEAIRHVFAKPGSIPSNHVRSKQFDPEAAVVLQKYAEKILFVPPAALHYPLRRILETVEDVMKVDKGAHVEPWQNVCKQRQHVTSGFHHVTRVDEENVARLEGLKQRGFDIL
jgi:hypothetical protein